ncbi:HAD family hydrolase [Histidinibacterium lentulum]|uniref:sulfotransferase-like domain-containing protein n=1 Tax=Histidinibacterium lentulum TaxID=2480588 RepID=UPI00161020A2|nr:HAD family hydrolase [Histidinibacterium lentulum]
MKIAAWSGPRNISTAMMYAFARRTDCAVWDEPFYAPYLVATGRPDPLREEILARHESDPEAVGSICAGPVPEGKTHWYMKHIALHLLDNFPTGWLADCTHIHLIRHPARVVASYGGRRQGITAHDIGFQQQLDIQKKTGGHVIDGSDIRANPRNMLERLCTSIGLPFDAAMLSWSAGGHPADGAWAPHWYKALHASTGFAGPEGPLPQLTGPDAALAEEALPYYRALEAKKIPAD